MTDWLPWGFVFMTGTFATLALVMRAVAAAPTGTRPDLHRAWWALGTTVVTTLAVYLLYIVSGESWIWYFPK